MASPHDFELSVNDSDEEELNNDTEITMENDWEDHEEKPNRITDIQSKIQLVKQERTDKLAVNIRERLKYELKLKELKKRYQLRYKTFLRETSVRNYTPYMKSQDVPGYLVVLQSNVLRNLHQLCVVDAQKILVEQQSTAMVTEMKRTIISLGDDRAKIEMQMLNHMANIQSEEQSMHQSYASILSDQTEKINMLQKQQKGDTWEDMIDQELDDLMELIASQKRRTTTTATRTTTTTTTTSHPVTTTRSVLPSLSPIRPSRGGSSSKTRNKLSLGEMLHMNNNRERTNLSSHMSISEVSDDNSTSSFSVKMSQSFTNMIWKDKRNKVISI
jgi:hypothetical protein